MSLDRFIFRYFCRKGDKYLKSMQIPDDIVRRVDIPYGNHGKWNLLDVYYPKGTIKPLPTIINIHGGGFVYSTKNHSQYYCMNLAQHGFTVVNFTYRLAPKIKFPTPVMETNQVMEWVCSHAAEYQIDLNNIFIIGDSAGAQIASQYCTIVTNPEYAGLFDIHIPSFKIKAVVLNCGMYDNLHRIDGPLPGIMRDYFGKNPLIHGDQLNVLKYINKNFPPTFVMSASNDFLLANAEPMHKHLQQIGIESICKIYGTKEQKEYCHVFHVNILSLIAKKCNDEECEFINKHVS